MVFHLCKLCELSAVDLCHEKRDTQETAASSAKFSILYNRPKSGSGLGTRYFVTSSEQLNKISPKYYFFTSKTYTVATFILSQSKTQCMNF